MKEQGFTLIELIITIAIAAILAMLAAPSFNERLASYSLRDQVYDKENLLNQQRGNALAEEKVSAIDIADVEDLTVKDDDGEKTSLPITFTAREGRPLIDGATKPPTGYKAYEYSDANGNTDKVYTLIVRSSGKVEVWDGAHIAKPEDEDDES